jgi:hypothetical protein
VTFERGAERGVSSPWRYDADRLVLDLYDGPRRIYEVDLERCRTNAQVVDWLAQVSAKQWATAAVVGALFQELNRLLDFQGTLCGLGHDHGPIDVRAVIKRMTS